VRKAERAWFLSEGEESEALRINGSGPIFCCYVLKLRMSSFLQNVKMGPVPIYSAAAV